MAREYRISPDGNQVAVSSDYPADGPMAFGVMDGLTATGGGGGHWATAASVADWATVDFGSLSFPEPPAEEEAPKAAPKKTTARKATDK